MAVVYATLIVKGKKTLDDVPALLKEQVQDLLFDLDVSLSEIWRRAGSRLLYSRLSLIRRRLRSLKPCSPTITPGL